MTGTAIEFEQYREIEELLYGEASLLDDPDLDKWIELYTEDGTYWMPASLGQEDPEMELSHIYDDRVMMEIRRRNFVHPRAASKDYDIRSSHLISNIRVAAIDEEGGRHYRVLEFSRTCLLYRRTDHVWRHLHPCAGKHGRGLQDTEQARQPD